MIRVQFYFRILYIATWLILLKHVDKHLLFALAHGKCVSFVSARHMRKQIWPITRRRSHVEKASYKKNIYISRALISQSPCLDQAIQTRKS